jgi:hypothetical protein
LTRKLVELSIVTRASKIRKGPAPHCGVGWACSDEHIFELQHDARNGS